MSKLSREQLAKAPSLAGRFKRPDSPMSDAEREVAEYQGLLDPKTGLLKPEALQKTQPRIPPQVAPPIQLSELVENPAALEEKLEEIKAETTPVAESREPLKVDESGLPPPSFSDGEPARSDSPVLPRDDKPDLPSLIREYQEPLRCGHCGWDIRQSFNSPAFDEEDKIRFIRHIMSSGRFYRDYELMGGQVVVRFRSRSQSEHEKIYAAALKQLNDGKLAGLGDVQAWMHGRNVAASVDALIDRGGEMPIEKKFDTINDRVESGEADPVDSLYHDVFSSRSTAFYSMVWAAWMEFERLYGFLASRAHEPDFWKAAAGAHS